MKDREQCNGFTNSATWLMILHMGYDREWQSAIYALALKAKDYAMLEGWLIAEIEDRAFSEVFPEGQNSVVYDEKTPTQLLTEELINYALSEVDYTNLAHHYFDAISDEERSKANAHVDSI